VSERSDRLAPPARTSDNRKFRASRFGALEPLDFGRIQRSEIFADAIGGEMVAKPGETRRRVGDDGDVA